MVKSPQKHGRARRWFLLGALALILIAVATPALADTFDGFENYAAGTQNPFTWTFTPDSGPCWVGLVNTGAVGSNLVNPFAGANDYSIAFQNACAGTNHNSFLGISINATQNVVSFSTYLNVATNPVTPSTDNVLLVMCGIDVLFAINGTGSNSQINLSTIRHWTQISGNVNTTPGTSCAGGVSIKVSAVAAEAGPFVVVFDNTLLTGANSILSPSDIHLISTPSGLPFNINPYNQSWVQVQYVTNTVCGTGLNQIAPNACQQNYVPTSYVQIPLTGANLVTVRIAGSGNPYYRSLIPTSTTDQVVYMDSAASVVQFNFQITDVSGCLGPGSTIALSIGKTTITSGYLDAQGNFFAALVPQAYNLKISNSVGNCTYSTTVNLQAPSSVGPTNVPITITQFTKPSGSGFVQNLAYNLAWSCAGGSLIAFYTDTALATSLLKVTIYNQTNTGTFVVGTPQSISGTIGQTQFTFNGILAGDGTYFALFQATNSMGIQNLGPVTVSLSNPNCPSQFPSILPQLPSFPIDIFGLNQILPNANGYSEIIAIVIIVLTAAVFSARSSAIGGIVVAFEVLWFFLALFIPSSYTLIYTFIISSVVGFLRYRRTRTGVLGQ